MINYDKPIITPTEADLRSVTYAFDAGKAFVKRLGVTASPRTETADYYKQVRAANPRSAGEKTRQQVLMASEERPAEYDELILDTANALGLMAPEYPFAGELVGDVVALPALPNASFDRATGGLQAVLDGSVEVSSGLWVAGSSKPLTEDAIASVEDWAPGAMTESDMAQKIVERLKDTFAQELHGSGLNFQAFHVENPKAKTEDITGIFIDQRHAAGHTLGKVAAVSTAIYVPFQTHKHGVIEQRTGVHILTRGVASRPETVADRKTTAFLLDTFSTLTSAAQHLQAINEKRL